MVPECLREISVTLGKFRNMAVRILRVVYAIEFLVALVATLSVWREIGGQYHLDLMPWYVKGLLTLTLALTVVKLTAVSAGGQRRRTVIWAWALVFLLLAGGCITFYYHLNEPLDEEEEGSTLSTSLIDAARETRSLD